MNELPKRVLAIGAHPDDLEIQMGGTLAKYSALGCQVCMAIATDGSAGHMVIPANELAEIRHKEAQESANVIGADFYWLGFRDELIADTIDTRLQFVELIRQSRPDIIFTHDPNDYHPDHRTVSKLVFDASFLSGLPNVKTKSNAHLGVQPLIYFDTSGGLNFQPSEYVDIAEVFKVKQTMFSKHVSQIQWLMDHDHIDIQRNIQVSGEYRGNQCSAALAEGFRLELCSPRLRTYRLLP
jgi:LmbE family N-acetylglucosaminyl deacetylase